MPPYISFDKIGLPLAFVVVVGCSGVDTPLRPVAPRTETPAEETASPEYHRRDWRHWIDADHDCQDTRQEVLVAESEIPVEFADDHHCRVKRGRWTCPYTGKIVTDPAELDIDHLVPLENASASGGWRWSRAKKQAFANDLEHSEALVAVLASANRQKGSKGPEAWLPRQPRFRCAYVAAWTTVKRRWALVVSSEEAAAIQRIQRACAD